jgi:hypothetical protein
MKIKYHHSARCLPYFIHIEVLETQFQLKNKNKQRNKKKLSTQIYKTWKSTHNFPFFYLIFFKTNKNEYFSFIKFKLF